MTRALMLLAFALVVLGSGTQSVGAAPSDGATLLYTKTAEYRPLAWMSGKDRFPRGATLFVQDEHGAHPLLQNFAASADPAVSFDASHILFAGKRDTRDHWQIWEISAAGGTPRQVSSCDDDCVRPFYLPGDRLTYGKKGNGRFLVMAGFLRQGPAVPLTFSPASSLPTDVLRDGRILFEATAHRGAAVTSEIYTVYSDGSGVEAYRCDHGRSRHAARQVLSGDVVFAEGRGLARFTSALAHQVQIAVSEADYAGDVVESPAGDWLLAARAGADHRFAILRWNPARRSLRPLIVAPDSNILQPTLVAVRPPPNRHPSALHDWSYANLLCLNAYTSKTAFKPGSISSVRLYARAPAGDETLLGESPVERDGSFYLRTPADQPLKVELVDADGRTLAKQGDWFWLRRGEQRVCVGCHAGPEMAPENAVPAALLRSTVPTDMTTQHRVLAGAH